MNKERSAVLAFHLRVGVAFIGANWRRDEVTMPTPRGPKRVAGQIAARGASVLTVQEGAVLLAYGATTLVIAGFFPQLRGNMNGTPRYRKFAVRADAPEDANWTDGTAVTAALPNSYAQSFNIASIGAFMYVQPAMGGSVSAGSAGEGFSIWQAWTNSTAMVVARQTVQIEPDTNTSQTAFIPLGKPFPALDLSGIMVAVAARGCSGTPVMNFVARTYTGDPSLPSAWGSNLLVADKTFAATNEDYNTGNIAYAPTGVAWAQIGMKVSAGNFYGTFDATVAAKY